MRIYTDTLLICTAALYYSLHTSEAFSIFISVRCMMFGFGDDKNPYTESVDYLEDMVVEYISEMVSTVDIPKFPTLGPEFFY